MACCLTCRGAMTNHGVACRHEKWQAPMGQGSPTFDIGFAFAACYKMLSAQVEGTARLSGHVNLHELCLPCFPHTACFGSYLMRAALCIDPYRIKLALRRQIWGQSQEHWRAVEVGKHFSLGWLKFMWNPKRSSKYLAFRFHSKPAITWIKTRMWWGNFEPFH